MAIIPKERGNIVNYYENMGTRTFNKDNEYWISLMLTNDGTSNIILIINNMTITVKAGETLDEDFVDFNTVSIQATGNYRLWLRE